MAPHHEDRERHGSHPIAEWIEAGERSHSEEAAERLEMDRNSPTGVAIPWSWQGLKELGYVVSVVLALASGYYGIRGDIQEGNSTVRALEQRMAGWGERVVAIERSRADVMPKFEESLRNNAIQDQRLQNLTEANARTATSVADLARSVTIWTDKVGDMRENMGRLEERVGRGLPHDR